MIARSDAFLRHQLSRAIGFTAIISLLNTLDLIISRNI
jgi:hypothetical protein